MSEVKLYHGDCLDILPTLDAGSVDAVITDMPYGVGIDYETYEDTKENLIKLIDLALPEMQRISNRVILTCGVANIHKYPEPTWTLCWACSGAGSSGKWGFSTWQPILVYGVDPYLASGQGRRPDLIYCNAKVKKKVKRHGHPCPKPLAVWLKVMERVSLQSETILDPFMGSGTTGVACVQTGRNFIGIEIDKGYYDIAEKRIKEAQLQMRMPI